MITNSITSIFQDVSKKTFKEKVSKKISENNFAALDGLDLKDRNIRGTTFDNASKALKQWRVKN